MLYEVITEALITTIGWNCDPYPTDWAEYLHQVIDGYGTDVKNLMKRSAQTVFMSVDAERNKPQKLGYWPSVEYIVITSYSIHYTKLYDMKLASQEHE